MIVLYLRDLEMMKHILSPVEIDVFPEMFLKGSPAGYVRTSAERLGATVLRLFACGGVIEGCTNAQNQPDVFVRSSIFLSALRFEIPRIGYPESKGDVAA